MAKERERVVFLHNNNKRMEKINKHKPREYRQDDQHTNGATGRQKYIDAMQDAEGARCFQP